MNCSSLLLQDWIDKKSQKVLLTEAWNFGCHQTTEELQHRVECRALKMKLKIWLANAILKVHQVILTLIVEGEI